MSRMGILCLGLLLPSLSSAGTPFEGSCADFHDLAQDPGWAGQTAARLQAEVAKSDFSPDAKDANPKSSGQWSCSCNKKIYAVESQCVNECETSLACFTNICNPVGAGTGKPGKQICGTTKAKLTFTVTNTVTVQQWQMPSADRALPRCVAAAQTFTDAVQSHEKRHSLRNEQIVANWNKAHAGGFSVKSCGESSKEAKDANDRKIAEQAKAAHDEIVKELAADSDRMHQEPGGSHDNINCAACQ